MWKSRGKMAISLDTGNTPVSSAKELAVQGFVTAVANPKGWAFFISLLPPFISARYAMAPQIAVLVSMVLIIEFICLLIYAGGGRTLRHFLNKSGNVRLMNRFAGSLMMGVGIWLAMG